LSLRGFYFCRQMARKSLCGMRWDNFVFFSHWNRHEIAVNFEQTRNGCDAMRFQNCKSQQNCRQFTRAIWIRNPSAIEIALEIAP
jgi:hypothetical protein